MLKLLTRGGGAVAIVGALIFSPMAVQSAQANEWDDGLKLLTSVGGGVAAASPAVLTEAGAAAAASTVATVTACAATVICGGAMVVAGVGLLAFTTKDYWVPWIQSWGAGMGVGGSTQTFIIDSGIKGSFAVNDSNWGMSQPQGIVMQATTDMASWAGKPDGIGMQWGGWVDCKSGTSYLARQIIGWVAIGGDGYFWKVGGGDQGPAFSAVANPCSGGYNIAGADVTVASGTTGHLVYGEGVHHDYNGNVTSVANTDVVTATNKVCQRPDGSTYSDTRSVSNATDFIPVGFCAPGDKAISLTTTVTPVGGSPQVVQTIPLTMTPAEVSKYPLCAGAACQYQILIDGVPCRVGQAGCSEWYAMSQATPSRITARYGPYAYPDVEVLRWLEHAYDSNTGVRVTTTTGTANDPTPKPDPIAGVPGVVPDWFHVPMPLDPNVPMPNPSPNPNNTGDCFTGTISWNPVDWVVTPVKCALVWAFIPDQAALAGPVLDFQTAWNSRPPGSLVVAASSVIGGLGDGWNGGCGGYASEDFSNVSAHPLRLPCTPTGGGAGSIPFTVMQVALIVGTAFALWHMVGAAVSARAAGSGD